MPKQLREKKTKSGSLREMPYIIKVVVKIVGERMECELNSQKRVGQRK